MMFVAGPAASAATPTDATIQRAAPPREICPAVSLLPASETPSSASPAIAVPTATLCRQGRDPDARQISPPLVDHEAALPLRKELPVEEQQVVELEAAL